MNKWLITTGISAATVVGGLLVWVASIAGDSADVKSRLRTVEGRQVEDRDNVKEERKETRQAINEVAQHVKQIDQATQVMSQKLTVLESLLRQERRRDR